ncbi:MAG TPA: ABC transporter substrate-binding protein [Thermomicrobiaceae bacterium]|nr:ABC transporter substrate-binding protein [Thermomicrobiaceae bacterium]
MEIKRGVRPDRSRYRMVAVLAVFAVVGAACGGGSSGSAGNASTSAATTATTAATSGTTAATPVTAAASPGAAAATPGTPATAASGGLQHIGGSVSVWAEWTSTEQQDFLKALAPFESQTGIHVNYQGKGNQTDTAVEAAVSGGAPPDVALVPDPGTLVTLAKQGKLQPVGPIIGNLSSNFGSAWNNLVTVNNTLYGVWFKGANKNTIWYNPAEFAAAGISSPPKTWEQLVSDSATLKAAGIAPLSLCTDVGWPVADMWQNVYLKTAGTADYNKLAAHNIPWTDPTVSTAFSTMGKLIQSQYLVGGSTGALSNGSYPNCVDKVFPKPGTAPSAAMVIEGDFVVSEITGNSSNYTAGTTGTGGAKCTTDASKTPCYDFFPFPAPAADSANNGAIQGAGDVAMLLKSTPQAQELIKYLAGPQGGAIWAHLGGFATPNKTVSLDSYPNSVAKTDAQELQNASSFVFSLDDLQGTWEHQMWQDMLNFVKNPTASNITSIEHTMDSQAKAALGH